MPNLSIIVNVTFIISYIIQNYLVYYILKVLWYYNKPSKPKQNHQMRRSEDPIKWKFFKVIALDSLYLANMICAFVSQNLNIEKIFLMYELLRIPEQGHIQNMYIPYYFAKGKLFYIKGPFDRPFIQHFFNLGLLESSCQLQTLCDDDFLNNMVHFRKSKI